MGARESFSAFPSLEYYYFYDSFHSTGSVINYARNGDRLCTAATERYTALQR